MLIFLIPIVFFLYANFRNKMFLGDSGSLFIAFVVGCFSIGLYQKDFFKSDDIIILMIVPGFDMFRLFVQRILKKRNPFKGDLNHFHHLVKKNYGYFFAVVINIFFVITLITLRFLFQYSTISLLIVFIFVYLLLFFMLSKIKNTKKI